MPRLAYIRQKLVDGRYRWGHVSHRTGRYGAESVRLVVYPPDVSTLERRCARVARLWPAVSIGAIVVLAFPIVSLVEVSALVVIGMLAALSVLSGAAIGRVARPVIERTVEAFVVVSFLSPRESDRKRYARVMEIAEDLHFAEQCLDDRRISWSRYKSLWAENYGLVSI